MDIPRPEFRRQRRIRTVIWSIVIGALVIAGTVALSRLEPAAPSVPRASVWIDSVKEGEMLRQVRGPGNLVPREIRWIPAQTAGRVERIIVRPGALVEPDTVLVEMSNSDLVQQTEEARLFAFDGDGRLRLVNRAGAELFNETRDTLRGRSARELALAEMLFEPSGRIVSHEFPAGPGRWEIRRRSIREAGRPLDLLVITDVSRALREEERQAWRRLVRVMGHELNSSLTPIKSMAATVRKLIGREPLPSDWRTDAESGLAIIHDRAEALGRFMAAYARLARLPPPDRRETSLAGLIGRAASLYGDRVTVVGGPDVRMTIDPDQVEQVMINLIKNAVEAVEPDGSVTVEWASGAEGTSIEVIDDGTGLSNTENLWVPFFSTKQHGTGLGLVLSREIVENHGGEISLTNRTDTAGCIARVLLPEGRVQAGI